MTAGFTSYKNSMRVRKAFRAGFTPDDVMADSAAAEWNEDGVRAEYDNWKQREGRFSFFDRDTELGLVSEIDKSRPARAAFIAAKKKEHPGYDEDEIGKVWDYWKQLGRDKAQIPKPKPAQGQTPKAIKPRGAKPVDIKQFYRSAGPAEMVSTPLGEPPVLRRTIPADKFADIPAKRRAHIQEIVSTKATDPDTARLNPKRLAGIVNNPAAPWSERDKEYARHYLEQSGRMTELSGLEVLGTGILGFAPVLETVVAAAKPTFMAGAKVAGTLAGGGRAARIAGKTLQKGVQAVEAVPKTARAVVGMRATAEAGMLAVGRPKPPEQPGPPKGLQEALKRAVERGWLTVDIARNMSQGDAEMVARDVQLQRQLEASEGYQKVGKAKTYPEAIKAVFHDPATFLEGLVESTALSERSESKCQRTDLILMN